MSEDQKGRYTRRNVLRSVAVAAGVIPVLQLDGHSAWAGQAPEKVSPDDPTAKALKYVPNAAEADIDRPAKAGTPGSEQFCHACSLYTADAAGGKWGACSIFQGRLVQRSGWCSAWVPQA